VRGAPTRRDRTVITFTIITIYMYIRSTLLITFTICLSEWRAEAPDAWPDEGRPDGRREQSRAQPQALECRETEASKRDRTLRFTVQVHTGPTAVLGRTPIEIQPLLEHLRLSRLTLPLQCTAVRSRSSGPA
jgi:hypothetical protein